MTVNDFADRLGVCVITDEIIGKTFEGPTRGDYPASVRVEVVSGEHFDVEIRGVPRCGCGKLGRWSTDYRTYTCCRNLGDGRGE